MKDKNEIFGKRLKMLRNRLGKNQEDVANDLGISRARYSHYENNHVEPDIEMIKTLADYYNVDTDYLFGRTDEPKTSTYGQDEDDEFEIFVREVRRWYKEAPKNKEEDLQRLKRIFEAYKDD